MGYVLAAAGVKVVHAEHFMPAVQQQLAEMRAEKARSAGHQDSFARKVFHARYFSLNLGPRTVFMFISELFYLMLQDLKLLRLAGQKRLGLMKLFCHSFGRKNIHVCYFVL
jgi:hypothetical protein